MADPEDSTTLPHGAKIRGYIVEQQIGEGGYGTIYSTHKMDTGERSALKVELRNAPKKGLRLEAQILDDLQDCAYFPKIFFSGKNKQYRYLFMELLGPSLSMVRRAMPDEVLGTYTILKSAIEMLKAIEAFHTRGYVHRDIKPGNFVVKPDRKYPICLIDFGLSKRYLNTFGEIIPPLQDAGFTGTCRYASLNAHHRHDLGRNDDLISWFYSLVELGVGKLPWPGSRDREETERLKSTMKPEEICEGLPPVFIGIYNLITKYTYNDKPDYQSIRKMLQRAIKDMNFPDKRYDWEKLSEAEIHEISEISLNMGSPSEETRCCEIM